MNLAETHDLLTFAAQYDNRRFDDATVIAWHAILSDLNVDDCRAAVMNHAATSDAYLKPVHIRHGVRAIRNDRAQAQPHEVRALPSRFEQDPARDERVQRGVVDLAQRWSMPDNDTSDPTRDRALERARRERKGRQAIPPRPHRPGGPGIQLDKVTRAPEWADEKARERASIDTLHQAGRHCGRHHCPRCTTEAADVPLLGDGSEPWQFGDNIDECFRQAEATLAAQRKGTP